MIMKRLIACMLIIASLLVCAPAYSAYIDVEDETLSYKIDALEQLGIISGYSDATYRPEDKVTRGEFAIYAARLFGIDKSEKGGYFSDVNDDEDYAGYVNALAEAGWVSGMTQGYGPQINIAYAEAVKIILNGMGYEAACEMQGGFPTGYLKMASRIGLGSGSSEELTRQKLALLFYNTLSAGMMEFSGMTGSGADFAVSNTTMMKKYHGLVQIEGIMSYNGETSIDGSVKEAFSYIVVDGEKIDSESLNCSEYLGYDVTVFAYEDENDGTLVAKAIVPSAGKNKILTFSAENIEGVTDGKSIRVKVDSVYKNYSLSQAAIIYNGGYCASYDDNLLMPEEGFIKLIDNNKDGRYEIIMIYDIIDDIISGVNVSAEMLYLESVGGISLADKDVYVYIDGKRRTLDDVGTGSAVSAAVGRENCITLWISTKTVSDVLQSSDEEYVSFANSVYPVSAHMRTDGGQISIGKTYTAYISWFGKAVKLAAAAKGDRYGWLMNILYEDDFEAPADVRMKILSDSGDIERLGIGEKIRINDKSYRLDFHDFQQHGLMDGEGKCIPQMIKYTTNDNGILSRMYTALDKTAYGIYEDGFSIDKRVRNTSTRMYRYNIGINYHLGASTKIFYLPLESEMAAADEKDYSVGSTGTFSSDIYYSNFDIYDTRPDRAAGVLVIRRTINAAKVTDKLTDALMKRELGVIIKSKLQNTGDDDEVTLQMLSAGKEITLQAQSADLPNSTQDSWSYKQMTAADLRRGDIILYSKNEKNEVCDFTIVFRGEELEDMSFYERTPSNITIDGYNDAALTPLHTVFGEVYAINGKTFSINVTQPAGGRPKANEMRHLTASASSYVYIMDYDEGRWYAGSLSDICSGDIVFMRAYNYVPQQIVVFRGA